MGLAEVTGLRSQLIPSTTRSGAVLRLLWLTSQISCLRYPIHRAGHHRYPSGSFTIADRNP
jgi:hypothetical protein